MRAAVPDDAGVLAAARIWSQAVARRDDLTTTRPLDEVAVGIRRRLALPGAVLLLAEADGVAAGFALVAPRGDALELFYLAVDPGAWGRGIAPALLGAVDEHGRTGRWTRLELLVIDANDRAKRAYERAGWRPTDETVLDDDSGRIERRFVRSITLRRSTSA
ncbi:GNAT family N-acetyltransferase [Arsenicicoccus bolidensis]|uniref:GNAT family N-acetyltransferase n=1 Tax=Arsenicicoccus bolidensis TaxID=229480 RepID=UPI0030845751